MTALVLPFMWCLYNTFQVSKLEFACNENEAKISRYESQIQELKNEVGKQRQIQALINSLSSGNTDISLQQSNNNSKLEWCFLLTLLVMPYLCKIIVATALTLSQTTNFILLQTERVCRWQFQIWWKWMEEVLQTGRKHCGKRRNCLFQAISPFPTVFL